MSCSANAEWPQVGNSVALLRKKLNRTKIYRNINVSEIGAVVKVTDSHPCG